MSIAGSIEFSEETKSKDNLGPPEISHVFSPIHKISLDVLHEIFVFCLPVNPTMQSAGPVILTLSLVSSTWRAAVISLPRLWSTLFVTVRYDDDLNKCAQVVNRWFQHARSAPLSFFLNIRFRAYYEDITRIHNFLVDLSSIMLRVWHFGLHARLTKDLLRSFIDLDWKFPLLKILDLFSHAGYDKIREVAFSFPQPLFQNAPDLVQVSIHNSITTFHDIQDLLPWSQLRYLNIAYSISISRWIEIMNMCPKLSRCIVVLKELDVDSFLPESICHNLKHLEFEINGCVPLLEPLSICNLPSLDTFGVLYNSTPSLGFSPGEISALTNLRKFSFNRGRQKISHEYLTQLTEVLREMVNLKVLILQQTTKDFIPLYEALSFKSPGEPILPQLGTFNMWITTDSEVHLPEQDEELDPLIEMLSSRIGEDSIPVGCKPLQKCIVGVEDDGIYERTKKRFDSLVGRLPPQFQFRIAVFRDFRFEQPDGWTYPISDVL